MHVSVYITAKDIKQARTIAQQLLKERLIACANIIPRIEALYWWKGEIRNEGEAAIIGKTNKENEQKIIKRVKELHSYGVPCIVFWPIENGNKDFLEWINSELRSA